MISLYYLIYQLLYVYFRGWFVRIYKIDIENFENIDKDFYFLVFVVVFIKFKKMLNMKFVSEIGVVI